jgi:hypothetical protein
MDISKKSRTELKAYFIKNAVPTESNFRDLIDGVLVQKDDGIAKSQDAPLSLEAQSSGERPIVHLYDSFASTSPNFVVSLLPGTTVGNSTTGRGLGIGNGSGANSTCIYIDKDAGTVGIGTVAPAGYKLAVAGTMNVTGLLTASAGLTVPSGSSLTINGTTLLTGGATVSGATLNANAGLTVPSGQALLVNGSVTLNSGATVAGSTLNANGGLSIPSGQTLSASGTVNLYNGATVSGGTLYANAGLSVPSGQQLAVSGTASLNSGATVSGGTLYANAGLSVPAGQTLSASGNVNLNAGATVAGGTLNANAGLYVPAGQSLTTDGTVSLKSGATVSGGTLNASSGLTVATGQELAANGTVNLNAGANVSGGTLNANGGLSVPSTATLTANGTVNINAGATVSGGTLNANGGLTVPSSQTLTANGTVKLNAGATVAGSALLAQAGATITGAGLTVGSATSAQPLAVYGAISSSAGATFTGAGVTVGSTTATQPLTVYGAISSSAGATFTGAGVTVGSTTSAQALAVYGTLSTSSNATVGGTLSVTSATSLSSLSTSGNSSIGGTLTVTSTSTLNNSLTVSGATQINNSLTVTSSTALKAGAAITGGALTVGTAAASQTATVYGLFTAAADAKVSGALTVTSGTSLSTLSTSGATTLGTTLGVTGATSLGGTLGVTGTTTLGGVLNVSGQANLSGALVVSGLSSLQSSVSIAGIQLSLDNTSRRGGRSGDNRRALMHESGDALGINYNGDYSLGVHLYSQLKMFGRTWLRDNNIYLRTVADFNHGMGYFGANRPFAGSSVDGPVLYGYAGGALGSIRTAATGVEGSLVLSGTNGHAVLPAMTDDFSGGITIEAWVYMSSLSNSYARIIDFGNGPGTDNVLLCQAGTSSTLRLHIYYNSTSSFYAEAASVFTSGSWMHLAATVDASGNVKMYKNGTSLTVTTTGTVTLPGSIKRNYCYVGRSNWTSDGYLQGKVAQLRVYTRALSADEISDRYDNTRVVSTEDLAGYWPLDDASGTSVRDASGNNRTGALSSANAAFETYQSAALTWNNSKNVTIGNNLTVGGDISSTGTVKGGNVRSVVTKTDAISTTKTAAEDVSGLSITATFDAGPVLIMAHLGAVSGDAANARGVFQIVVDGTAVYVNMQEFNASGWMRRDVVLNTITTVTAGSHTIKVQWYRDSAGSGTTLLCGLNVTAGNTYRSLSVIEL